MNNKKIKAPIINQTGFNNHQMDEFWMLDIFKKLNLTNDSRLFDLGANVGQTLIKWKACYPDNAYFGFEPIPECVKYLEVLINENNFKHCTIIPNVVYDQRGSMELNLHYNDNTDRSASLINNALKVTEIIRVESIELSEFAKSESINLNENDILKIDVEGAEYNILRSSQHLISNAKPILILEILSQNLMGLNHRKTFKLIRSLNYEIFRIKKHNNCLHYLEPVENPSNNYSVSESDFICFPIDSQYLSLFPVKA